MDKLRDPDKTIFRLSCESGLRISDILNLRRRNVRHNPLSVFETKSRRTRTIQISDELHRHLREISKKRQINAYVFYSPKDANKPYTRMTYHRHLKNAFSNASAHSGRKLYAQRIYNATRNIYAVQNALNHRYTITTLTYLDISLDALIATHHKNKNPP